jgi:hypothetical protein
MNDVNDVDQPDPSSPGPSGVAPLRGMRTDEEVRARLFAVVRESLRQAIADRERRQLISSRGDASATLFLDAARVEALLDGGSGGGDPAPRRLRTSLMRSLAATATDGPPLALALHRWGLAEDEVIVIAAALAAAVAPDLARLLAYLGGDASRPGLTVEAAAALLGDGDGAVIAVERMLSPASPVRAAGLLALGRGDAPLLRRTLDLHPRVIALAAGARAPENIPGRVLAPAPPGPTHFDEDTCARLRALVARDASPPVLGWIVGDRGSGLEGDLNRLGAIDGFAVLVTDLSALLEDDAAAGLVREARLARALVAVRTDLPGRIAPADAARIARALDRVAAAVPVCVVSEGIAEPELPTSCGLLVAVAGPSTAELRRAALAAAIGHRLGERDLDAVARAMPGGPEPLGRLAGPLALHPPGPDPGGTAMRLAAEQIGAPLHGPLQLVPAAPSWEDLAAGDDVRRSIDAVARAWQERRVDRLLVMFEGGTRDALPLAARLAADLRLRALRLDVAHLLAAGAADAQRMLARALEAAERGNAIIVDDRAHGGPRAGAHLDPVLAQLFRGLGFFAVLCASGPYDHLRRAADIIVKAPPAGPPGGSMWGS